MYVVSPTINFAWYQLLKLIPSNTYQVNIDKGSYEKQDIRYQFPSVTVEIKTPEFDMIPIVPETFKNKPTTMEYVERYFDDYIIGTVKSENEDYTYGKRIYISLEKIIDNIQFYPFSNQHVIEVAQPTDLELKDPPCLRLIDFKVQPDLTLDVHVYFRSWELWAGFPSNLAAIEMLKQYVVYSCEGALDNGRLYAYSSGLHIYGANLENVEQLIKEKIK